MKKGIKYLLSYILVLGSYFSFGQSRTVDSLLTLIKTDKADTNKVNHLNKLAYEFEFSNTDTAISFSKEALQLAESIKLSGKKAGWQKGIGISNQEIAIFYHDKSCYSIARKYYLEALTIWNNLLIVDSSDAIILNFKSTNLYYTGMTYNDQGDSYTGLNYYFQALAIVEKLGNKKVIAIESGNIGKAYSDQGNFPKALDYYFKALKMGEELGDKKRIAIQLGNIGIVFRMEGELSKALDYYLKALKINEERGNKKGQSTNLGNIGTIYDEQGNQQKALDYYFKALKIVEELNDKSSIAIWLGNIGQVYNEQGNNPKVSPDERNKLFGQALDYYFKALKIDTELGNKNSSAAWLESIGDLYVSNKKYAEAEKYLIHSISIYDSIGALAEKMQSENTISNLYSKWGNDKKALKYLKEAIVIKDSLFNMNKNKEITRKEMNYEFDKKEAITKAGHEKEIALEEADKKRQGLFLWFTVFGLCLMVIVALTIFRSLRTTRKQKYIIEKQKNLVEKQKKEVEHQKILVEEHQKEIIDSITYARRIQRSLLPTEKYIERSINRLRKS